MVVLGLARGRGAGDLLRMLLEGEPVAWLILIGAVALTGLIVWLSFYLMKQQGKRLADAIGDCTYSFAPDGLFGKRFYSISGVRDGITFSLEARKTGQKGDHRTDLRLAKLPSLTWEQIKASLVASRELVDLATEVNEQPDAVTLTYVGVGGDPDLIRTLLREVSSVAGKRSS